MKKITLIATCLICITVLLSACSAKTIEPSGLNPASGQQGNDSPAVERAATEQPTTASMVEPTLEPTALPVPTVNLLSGYPVEVLPLYESKYIDAVSFDVREGLNYVVGKDIYSVRYYSQASLADLLAFYLPLIDPDTLDNYEDTVLSGKIGVQPVQISFYEGEPGLMMVSMTIGLNPEEYVTENPYFVDFPYDAVTLYGEDTAGETSYRYEERLMGGQVEVYYTINGSPSIDRAAFEEFYRSTYSAKEGFYEKSEETTHTFVWYDQGVEIHAWYSSYAGGKTNSISISVSRK